MKHVFTLVLVMLCSLSIYSQTFPNLVATDIEGVTHDIQADYLDQGIPVLVHFWADWNYWDQYFMEFNSMQNAYSDFGPNGSGQIMMLAFEIDEFTTDEDLMDTNDSLPDWTSLINYPIINLDDPSWGTVVMNTFAMPSLALFCPDGTIYTDGSVAPQNYPFTEEDGMAYGNFLTVEGVVDAFEQFCGNFIADENVSGTVTFNTVDCTQDLSNPLKNVIVTFDDQNGLEMRSTNYQGQYEAFLDDGTYDISFDFNSSMMSVCYGPDPVTVNGNVTTDLDAYYIVDILCPEIQLSLNPWILRECDLNSYLQAEICNTGTVDLDVFTLDIIFPAGSNIISVNTGDPYTYDATTGNFSMTCDSLETFSCKELLFTFNTPCDIEVGDTVCFSVLSNPLQIDPNCAEYIENELEDCTAVIGSFDPNDKTGLTESVGPDHYISAGTELEYMIRFQNTGTDTAFTVRIEDQMSDLFEYNTIRPLASSHNYEMSFAAGKLEFLFPNILLVDSFKNEPLSHGFITFKVKLRDDLPTGTKISNTASIFFDSNEPVITNTFDYNIPTPSSIYSSEEFPFNISPNPAHDEIRVEAEWLENGGSMFLYDLKGSLIQANKFEGNSMTFPLDNISAGLYFVKIQNLSGISNIQKLIVE